MRKGQHLALESAATFGLMLIAAIGVIHAFNTVNKDVVETTQGTQSEIAADRVKSAMLQMSYLSDSERGYKQIELPEEAGNQDYRVAVEPSSVTIFVGARESTKQLSIARPSQTVRGSIEGGSVRLFKNSQGYNLREGR